MEREGNVRGRKVMMRNRKGMSRIIMMLLVIVRFVFSSLERHLLLVFVCFEEIATWMKLERIEVAVVMIVDSFSEVEGHFCENKEKRRRR